MNLDNKKVLVIGATGRHGGTGATVAQSLLDQGVPIRILTRSPNTRLLPFEALGAEIAIGDLHDRRSLGAALKGVELAYFTYPILAGLVDATANFASAAREAGLKRLVVMSMAPAQPDSVSQLGRAQWLAEQIFEWAGFSCIYLRIAAIFFEDIDLLHGAEILAEGRMRNSFHDVPVHWMSGKDAGKLAVAALLHPNRFGAGGAVYPTGHENYTNSQVAAILSLHLGRTVLHETISAEAWRNSLIALSKKDDAINVDMANHIAAVGGSLSKAIPSNDLFETVTLQKQICLMDALMAGKLIRSVPSSLPQQMTVAIE
jgi:uncharacterized protein YbjT (DUF2867 family)